LREEINNKNFDSKLIQQKGKRIEFDGKQNRVEMIEFLLLLKVHSPLYFQKPEET